MSDVVTFGLHIADVLGRYVTQIPPGQGLERIEEIRITVAGTAAATAVDLAKVGVEVATVGALGRDTLGDFVRRTMDDFGVDTRALLSIDEVQTSATILPIRPDGSRPALHVPGANARLTVDAVTSEITDGIRVFHWGGACLLSAADGEPGANLLSSLQSAGVVTTLDCLPTGTPSDREALFPL
ncbi:MAG: carbohydrate kinase family protein, partial [Micrococcales bacterium]|nr:carbohydrate kinase family protein [Micrococcales bacterium]